MYDLLITNGKLVSGNRIFEANIAVKDGKFAGFLAKEEKPRAAETVDAKGNYVFPGVIDSHAHLNDPGYTWREDYAHGTAAAAVGGVTTVVDMPLQNKPALIDKAIMNKKLAAVSPHAMVDYCFWGGLVDHNFDKLEELHNAGCTAFKSFIGPVSDYTTLTIGQAREALQILAKLGARAGFHCEDYSIIKWEEKRQQDMGNKTWRGFLDSRPLAAEFIAVQNILELARETGAKIHICHVSHPAVARLIKDAKTCGIDVSGETCGHYLVFTEDDVIRNGALFKCAPPLRSSRDRDELWNYVKDGTIDCVGSDHSPCTAKEKDENEHGIFGVWGGISGIQSMVQVMFSEGVIKRGYCPTLLARVLAEGPARAFGIYGKKGALEIGFDADLVILDPDKEWEITADSLEYLNKISAFVGFRGRGYPILTIVRGKVVAKDGKPLGPPGYGEWVKRL
jgi:allantoinase